MPASRVLLLVAFLLALIAPALGQHGVGGEVILEDLPVEQRQRARRLFAEVVCDCPRENWSKTLANCPDGCSDPQKQEVLRGVAAGLTDEQILDEQVRIHGTRARASPQDTWTYLLPVLVLVACASLVVVVYARWSQRASAQAASQAASARPEGVSDAELAAVERELEELT